MVVKVQLPLAANAPLGGQKALVTNQDQTFVEHANITDELKHAMHGKAKAFFNVRPHSSGVLYIDGEVPDPGW